MTHSSPVRPSQLRPLQRLEVTRITALQQKLMRLAQDSVDDAASLINRTLGDFLSPPLNVHVGRHIEELGRVVQLAELATLVGHECW